MNNEIASLWSNFNLGNIGFQQVRFALLEHNDFCNNLAVMQSPDKAVTRCRRRVYVNNEIQCGIALHHVSGQVCNP